MQTRSRLMAFVLFILLTASQAALAENQPLKSFKASFDVRVLGFAIGEAFQEMQCHDQHCELKSKAVPPSWARRWINEEAIEVIQLNQSEEGLRLQEYKKYLTRHYDDKTIKKTYTIQRQQTNNRFQYLEGDKSFPLKDSAFDVISLAYAIQYHIINHLPLNDLYLQDEKIQQKLAFSQIAKDDSLYFEFAEDMGDDGELSVKRFAFSNDKIAAKLWLIPSLNYFPGQIEIYNKTEDRTITLELNKKPKLKN